MSAELEQALAIFNQSYEEVRFFRSQRLEIAHFTLLAYAAIAATCFAVPRRKGLFWVKVFASFLVVAVAYQASQALWSANELQRLARDRYFETIEHLPLIDTIYAELPPKSPSEKSVLLWRPDRLPRLPYAMGAVVIVGAVLAIGVIWLRTTDARDNGRAVSRKQDDPGP